MDTDFHYFGTGTSARAAGFSPADAAVIANAAEFVDWYNSDYWSKWQVVDVSNQVLDSFSTPQLSCQSIGAKMAMDYDEDIWNAFHFPPGNLPHPDGGRADAMSLAFRRNHHVRPTVLQGAEVGKLCRPYSKFAQDLLNDTITMYVDISSGATDDKIDAYLHPRARYVSVDRHQLALVFLGVRMHILADTWAHQDFTGGQNNDINSAGTLNYVYATKQQDALLEPTVWKGSVWFLASDSDCAAAPDVLGASRGHGQIGHFPDYSWLTFVYPPKWMVGAGYLLRDNPKEYLEAWAWLTSTMARCRGNDFELKPVPADIEAVLRTKRTLSSTELRAVYESEADWASKTSLAHDLAGQPRWNAKRGVFDNAARVALGVADGSLPTTRFQTLRVKKNSVVHLMELASAIHMQWCINWLVDNPAYRAGWAPKQITGRN